MELFLSMLTEGSEWLRHDDNQEPKGRILNKSTQERLRREMQFPKERGDSNLNSLHLHLHCSSFSHTFDVLNSNQTCAFMSIQIWKRSWILSQSSRSLFEVSSLSLFPFATPSILNSVQPSASITRAGFVWWEDPPLRTWLREWKIQKLILK